MAETTQTPGGTPQTHTLSASGADVLTLPEGLSLSEAEFAVDGSDLVLTFPDGSSVTVENYYEQAQPPQLASADGANLSGDMVVQLTGTPESINDSAIQQFADAAGTQVIGGTDGAPIGTVKTLSGEVWVTRADGTRVQLQAGDEVFQGDSIETGADGAIGVLLADETTFSMGEASSMVLDEMVYDPATQNGSLNVSVVQGVFTFVSGQVAKTDPDAMKIDTPVATIGIRGTQVGIEIPPDGEMQIVLMQEADGFVGEVVIENNSGQIVMNQGGDFVSIPSYDSEASQRGTMNDDDIVERHATTLKHLPVEDTDGDRTSGNHFGLQEDIEQGSNEQPTPEELAETETAAGQEEQPDDNQVLDNPDQPSAEDLQDFQTDAGGQGFGEDFTNVTDEIDPFAPNPEGTGLGEQQFSGPQTTYENTTPTGQQQEDDSDRQLITQFQQSAQSAYERAVTAETNAQTALTNATNRAGTDPDAQAALQAVIDAANEATQARQQAEAARDDANGATTASDAEGAAGAANTAANNAETAAGNAQQGETQVDQIVTLSESVNDADFDINEDDPFALDFDITPNNPDSTLQVTLSGIPDGVTLTNTAGDEIEIVAGTATVSGDQLAGLTVTPAEDSDVDFQLGVSVVETTPEGTVIGPATATIDIDVDGVADAPVLSLSSGNAQGAEVPLNISAVVGDVNPDGAGNEDGAETIQSITISDIPVGATILLGGVEQTLTPLYDDGNGNLVDTIADIVGIVDGLLNGEVPQPVSQSITFPGDADLSDLSIISPTGANDPFDLTISAVSEEDGTTAETTQTLSVTPANVADGAEVGDLNLTTDEDTAIALPISITKVDESETAEITLSGIPAGAVLVNANGPISINGDGTVTLTEADLAGLQITPPTDSDVDFDLGVSVVTIDGDVRSDPATGTIGIDVDGIADVPNLTVGAGAADGAEVPLNIAATVADFNASGAGNEDGAETIQSITISDIPVGAVILLDGVEQTLTPLYDDGNGNLVSTIEDIVGLVGGLLNGEVPQPVSQTISFAGDVDLSDLTIVSPIGSDETYDLTVTAVSEEDGTTAENSATLTVTPPDYADGATVDDLNLTTDEDTAIALPISITKVDESETAEITLSGIPAGAKLSNDGGPITVNEDGTVTLTEADLAGLQIEPPADSDVDFDLGVSVVTTDGTDTSDPATGTIAIGVDGVADLPTLNVGSAVEGTGFRGDAIPLDVSSALTDTDGSETLSVSISGVPEGATLSAGTYDSATDTWTLTPDQLDDLSVSVTDDYDTDFQLTVTATSTEGEGGDTATNTATIDVDVNRDVLTDGDDTFTMDDDAVVYAGDGDDTITTTDGDDVVFGEDGDDTFIGGLGGSDAFIGGAGTDTVDYSALDPDSPIYVNLTDDPGQSGVAVPLFDFDGDGDIDAADAAGAAASGDYDYDLLNGIEDVIGGAGDDIIVGSDGANVLVGGLGDDLLSGGGGDDVLEGGAGDDTIIGGEGTDTAVFEDNFEEFTINLDSDSGELSVGGSDIDGNDTLIDVEVLQFGDLTITVEDLLDAAMPDLSVDAVSATEDTEVALPIDAALADSVAEGTETLSVTLSGIPEGAVLRVDGVPLEVEGGSYTFADGVVPEGLTIQPPADSAADFEITVTATSQSVATEDGVADTAQNVQTFKVTVAPDAEAPVVTATEGLSFNEDAGAIDVGALFNATPVEAGEVVASFTIGGLPEGAALSGAFTDNGDGTFTIEAADLGGVQLTLPDDYDENFALEVSATSLQVDPDDPDNQDLWSYETSEAISVPLEIVAQVDAPTATVEAASGVEDGAAIPLEIGAATAAQDIDGEVTSFTVSDIPIGATLNLPGGFTFTATEGNTSIDLSPDQADALSISLPEDFTEDFSLTVTATATETDPETGTTTTATSAPVSLDVSVEAVADAPTVNLGAASGNEGGGPIALDIDPQVAGQDLDGEITSVTISSIPPGAVIMLNGEEVELTPLYDDGNGNLVEELLDGVGGIVGGILGGGQDEAPEPSAYSVTFPGDVDLSDLTITMPEDHDEDFTLQVSATASETDPESGEITYATSDPVDLNVSVIAQADAPTATAEAASGFEDGAAIPLEIDATTAAQDIDGEVTGFTVSDIPVGATLNLPGGFTFTATEGNTSIDLTPDLVDGLSISLPEDFDTDFSLTVTATASETDPDTGEVTYATSDPVSLDVSVEAVADAPTVDVAAASGNEDGGPIALDIDPAAAAQDINGEVVSVTITGVPAGATLSSGSFNADTGEWTVDAADVDGLTVSLPEDFTDDFTLQVAATASETDPESGEITYATSDPVDLNVSVIAQADAPTVDVAAATGDEDLPIALDIDPAAAAQDINGEVTSVTISDIPVGATMTLASGIAFTASEGNTSISLTPAQLEGLTITAPADSADDFQLTVTATASETDPDTGEITHATSDPVALDVTVQGVADGASVADTSAAGTEDIAVPFTLDVTELDVDGSETLSVTLSNIPEGAVILRNGVEVPANDDGSVTLGEGELDGLSILPPADFSGSFDLTVSASTTDEGDQSGVSTGTVSIDVAGVADGAEVGDLNLTTDEDTAIALPISIDKADGSETAEITLSGIPAGAVLANDNGLISVNEDGTVTLSEADLAGLQITPPADSGVDFDLGVSVVTTDGTSTSDPATGTISIDVDGVADAPTLTVGNVSGFEDNPIPLNIQSGLTDTDGSEVLSVTISGVPEGASLSAGSYDADTGEWTLSAAELDGLSILPAADDDSDFQLTVTATSTDTDPETGETTTATTVGTMDVSVDPLADAPVLTLGDVTGNEDTAIPLNISATLQDDSEVLGLSISGIPDGAVLTVTNPGGQAVQVNVVDGVAQIPNGLVGGDLAITPPLDSADDFQLTVTATAKDGNSIATTEGTLNVTVQGVADGAAVTSTTASGLEDTLIPITVDVEELDTDGSEALSVTLSNIPQGAVILRNGDPVTFNEDGTVTLGEGELDGLEVLPPADFSGTFDIAISAVTTDEGDVSEAALGSITVDVAGVADGATVTDTQTVGDEDTGISLPLSIDKADDSETAEITLSGIPAGAELSNDNGPINVVDGIAVLTEADLAGLQITPPANSDVDFQLGVSVVTTDGTTVSDPAAGTITVGVDGVADVPTLEVASASGVEDGGPIALDISSALTDTDGSESLSISISGVPQGATLSAGSYDAATDTWTLSSTELTGLTVTPAADSGDDFQLTVTATSTEADGGDTASQTATIDVSVASQADAPTVTTEAASGLEDAGPIALNIDADAAAQDVQGEVTSFTISDIPVGAVLNLGNGFQFTATEGNTSVDLTPGMVDGLSISLPEDFDENFSLQVSATAEETDPDTGAVTTATSTPVSLDVEVGAVADAPSVTTQGAAGTEDGGPIALDIDPVAAAEDINGEVVSVTVSNIPQGAVLSAGTIDPQTGDVTLTVEELEGLTIVLPQDFSEDFSLSVTATAQETDPETGAVTTATSDPVALDVSVAAQVDAPDVTVGAASGIEDGDAIPLDIDAQAAAGDINGEVVSVTVSDIPVGATLNLGGGFTFTATEGNTSVNLTPGMVDGLSISLPEDFDEDFSLSVSATAQETDPETGAISTATSEPVSLGVSVEAVADTPTIEVGAASGNEDGGPIPLDIDPAAAAQDINGEITSVTISNIPPGAVIMVGGEEVPLTPLYDDGNGNLVEELLDDVGGIVGGILGGGQGETPEPAAYSVTFPGDLDLSDLTITMPEDHDEDFTLQVSATAQETDPETGTITTSSSDPVDLNVSVIAQADAPSLSVEAASGDEDTAIALNIDPEAAAQDINGEVTSVTISDIPVGATLTLVGGLTFTATEGNTSVDLTPAQLEGLTITPLADSADDFQLTVTATATETDPDTGEVTTATSAPETLDVTVQGVADGAQVTDTSASGTEDTAIPLTIDVAELDTDGSEALSVTLSNIPDGAVLTRNGQPLEVVNGEITLAEGELDGLEILPPADFSGSFDIAVSATTTDEGDVSTPATGTISVDVSGDADGATVTLGAAEGDEDTFIDLPISIDKADASETAEITLTGIPAGAVLVNDNGPVSVVDGIAVLTEGDLAGLQIKAPADSGADFGLGVSVVTTDGTTASDPTTGTINVGVDAVADVPTLTVGSVSGTEDSAIPLNIVAGLNDEDGSEVLSVTISDVPPGAKLTLADGTSFTATEENSTFLFAGDQLDGLTVTPPENSDDDFTLNVIATSLDTDPDTGEVTTASAEGSLAVSVDPEADAPTLVLNDAAGTEDLPIALNIDAGLTDASEVLSVSISDIPEGATLTLANGTEFTASEGNTSYDIDPADLAGLTITPPSNSNDDFALTVTATSTESDGSTATSSSSLNVAVTGDADAPTLSVSLGEGTLTDGGSGGSGGSGGDGGYVGDGSDLVNQFVDGTSNTHTAGGGDDVWVVDRDLRMNENFIMGGGNDTLVINGDVPGGVNINLGGHNDSVTINGDITGNVSINGAGQTNGGGDVVYLGKGQDSYEFQNYTIQPNGMINTQVIDLDTGQTLTINNVEAIAFDDGTFVGNEDLVQFQTPGGGDPVVEYPLDISAGLTDIDGSETLSASISGVPEGATLTLADGTVLTSTGPNDSIDLPTGQLQGITMTVPSTADSFSLSVTATATENDGDTASVTTSVGVSVDDFAEDPELALSDGSGTEDLPIALDISAALTDTDGSESLSVTISGVPDGAVLKSGDTVLTVENGEITFADGVIPDGLTITAPPNSNDDFALNVSATSTESSTGDQSTVTSTLNVAVAGDADAPTLSVDLGEGNFVDGGTSEIPGSVTIENAAQGEAGYHNTYGYYIKGEDGTPQSGEIIWADVKDTVGQSFTLDGVNPEDIGFFIIPNGDGLNNNLSDGMDVTFTQGQDGNWHVVGPTGQVLSGQGDPVLFSDPALNEGNFDYTQDTSEPGNQNWEDLAGGGDNDFNDVHIQVDTVPSQPGAGGQDMVEYPLSINSELQDIDGSETLSATISGLPAGAMLALADGTVLTSTDAGDTFDLTSDQLTGITLSVPADATDFDLSVTATATEDDGDTASVSTSVSVDVPEPEGPDLTVTDAQGDEDTAITLNIAAAFEGGGGEEVSGSFYLLEEGADSIVRINLDGSAEEVVTQEEIMAATGENNADFDNQGVATDASGNIFFTELESESLLMKPADGGPVQVVASESAIRAATGEDDADLAGMTIATDGKVYMVDDESDSLIQVDPATGAVTVVATRQELDDLAGIRDVDLEGGIVAGPDGKVHFVSAGDPQAVFSFDTATGEPSVLAKSDDCEWSDLDGYITMTPDGDVVIVDESWDGNSSQDAIYIIDADTGESELLVSNAQLRAAAGGEVDLEGGISFDADGNLYVAEERTDTIYKFDADGNGGVDGNSGSVFVSKSDLSDLVGQDADLEGGMFFAQMITEGDGGLSISISGIPEGAVLAVDGQPVTVTEGTAELTADQLSNLTITPPVDSDEDFSLTITATGTTPNGQEVSSTASMAVTVDAVADAPNVTAEDASGVEDMPIDLDITAELSDLDGSETITGITISGVPAGATLSNGTYDEGSDTWTLQPADLVDLQLNPAANSNEDFQLTITATSQEADGGDTAVGTVTMDVDVTGVVDDFTVATQDASGEAGTELPLDLSVNLTDLDGSETVSVTLTGIPEGATLNHGTFDEGSGNWTLSGDDLDGLTISLPESVEGEGGGEPTTLYSQNFNSQWDGQTADWGENGFTSTGGQWGDDDHTAVDNDRFEFQNPIGGDISTWSSAEIDISGQEEVSFTFDLKGYGDLDSGGTYGDYVKVIAVVDGVEHELMTQDGDVSDWTNVTLDNIPEGDSLVIKMEVKTTGSDEKYKIDNLEVTGTPAAAEPLESFQIGVETTVTENDGASETVSTTLNVDIDSDNEAEAPALTVTPASGDEDTAIALDISAALTDTDGSETLSVTLSGIPNGAELRAGGQVLSVTNGEITFANGVVPTDLTVTPPTNSDGDFQLTVEATSTEENGGATSTTTSTINVTVDAVADQPVITSVTIGEPVVTEGVEGEGETVTISSANFGETDAGFTVTARTINSNGSLSDASEDNVSTNGSPLGFGVAGDASGADSELGYDSDHDVSEELIVTFDDDVSSVDVAFAWMHSGEQASFTLYRDGVAVGTGTVNGVTDNIDDPVTLSTTDGGTFDQIVFSAPSDDDDFLINSISFETGGEATPDVAEYPIDISANLVDIDGSEDLSVTIGGIPSGATLSAGTDNGDGTWTVGGDALSGLSLSVPFEDEIEAFDLTFTATATEQSNDDTASSAMVTVTAAAVVIEEPVGDVAVTAAIGEGTISEADDAIVYDLDISASVDGEPAGEDATITVSGIPTGVTLSAGTDNGDGSYSLSPAQLSGLQMLVSDAVSADFSLAVTASQGDQVSAVDNVLAEVDPSLFLEIGEEDFDNDHLTENDSSADDWTGNYQSETKYGSRKNDELDSGGGGDTLYGGAGNDELSGSWGEDTLYGGSGKDELEGGSQDDVLYGGSGNDELEGDSGADTLHGGSGNDEIEGGSQDDLIFGGSGNDEIDAGSDDDTVYGGAGNDEIDGDSGNDIIYGGTGNDEIDGGSGHDFIHGGAGNDEIEGGSGSDTLYGGSGNDEIEGGYDADALFGGLGDDFLDGGSGNDVLVGGAGNDTLVGGDGSDTFIFDADSGHDIIEDIMMQDTLEFQGEEFDMNDMIFSENDEGDAVISFAGKDDQSVTLKGVKYDDLDTNGDGDASEGYSITQNDDGFSVNIDET